LSDLAVDQAYQRKGIGKRLIEETHKVSGEITSLVLLAAPDAAKYYQHIGMEQFGDCFLIRRKSN
jgi:GNAT superfamily N-acetyltransferase